MQKFILVFALLVTCLIPMKVKAENKSYTIDKLNNLSYNDSDIYLYDTYDNSFFLMNLYMWDNINDSIRHNTIDNNNNNNNGGGNDGGFGGFSGGGDFSGGGGGDSGAF